MLSGFRPAFPRTFTQTRRIQKEKIAPHPTKFKQMSNQVKPQEFVVLHDKPKRVFYIALSSTDKAVLEYDEREGELDFYHTEVPPQYRGKGIAEVLAKAGMEYVKTEGKKARLTCSYLSGPFLSKFPEMKEFCTL
eukprot:TRINITY_DN3728_c0_g2_i1.p1 TRINITY_DN3728_c0_g2~~TRINITY_DN3728_c0_g2_i1.p1  ORF type:complete len:135 (-),score=35.61 TRINITY_DN3728_c0_g2_i1:134-538(-)